MSRYNALKVTGKQQLTRDAVALTLEVPAELKDAYSFAPGQYVNVRATIDGEDVRRSYSICAIPADGALRIGVKHVADGRFSTYANKVLQPGDTLEVMPPQGKFTLQTDPAREGVYVFFAAGSGITPVIALIRHILKQEPRSHVILFYGNQATDTIMFKDELEAIKNLNIHRFGLHFIMSREQQSVPLYNGRIDADKCTIYSRIFFDPGSVQKYFICGPGPMIETVRNWLNSVGTAPEKVAFELFGTPVGAALATKTDKGLDNIDPAHESQVTVKIDGLSLDFALPYGGQSILDASMAAGADVPFSCKGGVCCTCKAKLLEGDVRMDVVYGLEPDEIDAGFILTCQAHPVSEKVSVDYDIR